MLAKLTAKNQLTLPKRILAEFAGTEYFDVTVKSGRIVLEPVRIQRADAVRSKLAELGIDEQDVENALQWARGKRN